VYPRGSPSRRKTLSDALTMLNKRERRIFETRRLAEEQIALVELAQVSR
jgi:RNA polymerase sigma-32 factor